MRFPTVLLLSLFVPCLGSMLRCAGEEGDMPTKQIRSDSTGIEDSRKWFIPIPTFGGLQVWTDFSYRQGYRIQHNAVTDNWRLLDGNDRRRMWGTREQCEAFLNKVSKHSESEFSRQHCVVLIHGLMRTKHSMTPLQKVLQKECDCEIVSFTYASTRGKIRWTSGNQRWNNPAGMRHCGGFMSITKIMSTLLRARTSQRERHSKTQ